MTQSDWLKLEPTRSLRLRRQKIRTTQRQTPLTSALGLVPAGSEADTPLFMLVPREEVVGSGKQVDISSLIAALETLERNNKVSLEHGKSRYVGHASSGTKYTCSGVAPNHGGKGIRESGLKDLPEAQWKVLIKFV